MVAVAVTKGVVGVAVVAAAVMWLTAAPPLPVAQRTWELPEERWGARVDAADVQGMQVADEDVSELAAAATAAIRRGRLTATPIGQGYGVPEADLRSVLSSLAHANSTAAWPTWQWLRSSPNYAAIVSGLRIHFLHFRTPTTVCQGGAVEQDVMEVPLLLLHGWPGSVLEFMDLVPRLVGRCHTLPPRAGEAAGRPRRFVIHVVAPSLPGYGFSDGARRPGLDPLAMGRIFHALMTQRCHYPRYLVQGGDWGGVITVGMAQLDWDGKPRSIPAIHTNFVVHANPWAPAWYAIAAWMPAPLRSWWMSDDDVARALSHPHGLAWHLLDITGYMHEQATRPDTLAAVLASSPIAWLVWQMEKMGEWSDLSGVTAQGSRGSKLTGKYPPHWLLSNWYLYQRRGVDGMATSLRLYAETLRSDAFAVATWARVSTPTAVADFPGEMVRTPRVIAQHKYRHLLAYDTMPRGGHFAACEEPALLADHILRTLLPQWA